MIVDTSAIVALIFREPRYEEIVLKLQNARAKGIGAPTIAETGIVLTGRHTRMAVAQLTRLLQRLDIVTVPFGEPHWSVAVEAFDRFGRGRHPARLNFGDCLTYAVAKLADEPLLCTGSDFAKTDLAIA